MAVVAQRQRRLKTPRQWFETAEMIDPFGLGQAGEADALGPALVAVAQDVPGVPCGNHFVVKFAAERGVGERRAELGRDGHMSISGRRVPALPLTLTLSP